MSDEDCGKYRIVTGRKGWNVFIVEKADIIGPTGKIGWSGVDEGRWYACIEEARLAIEIERAKDRVFNLRSKLDSMVHSREGFSGQSVEVIEP